jgi:DNA-binding NarL/FixJ family response regulator
MKLTILLADDHALFRDGIRYVLQQLAEEVEILDAASFPEAMKFMESRPDINLALMDLNMPGSEGALSVRAFCVHYPKMTSGKVMLGALRMVLDGGVYLPPQLLQQSVEHMEHNVVDKRSRRTNEFGLTARQVDVLQYLARGLSNKEISLEMNLAEGTVKIHVAAIFQTLHVNNRVDAVRTAQRLGMLSDTESA